jgi:hypothetical protein
VLHEKLTDLLDAEALVGGDGDPLEAVVLQGLLLAVDEVFAVVDL